MSFTRRQGLGHPRQIIRREDHHIVRNAHVHRTVSSAAFQAYLAPSLGAPASSRTIRRHFAEEHFGSRRPLLDAHRSTPQLGVVKRTKKMDFSGIEPRRL
ncbi:transposable element Tcb2 transposase [Trichonephila clavipes]|nr:transposable element Tcb2 transposase [Trichonephila clavipes]